MALAITTSAQKGKRVKAAVKEKIESRDTVPNKRNWMKKGTVRTEPVDTVGVPAPQAGSPPFNLDTAIINGLTLKARDWAYLTASVDLNRRDSATWSRLRIMKNQIEAQAISGGWNANITVNGLPAEWIVKVYEFLQLMTVGMSKQMDPAAITAIRAKTNLQFWFDEIDAAFPLNYTRDRDIGKHVLLEQ